MGGACKGNLGCIGQTHVDGYPKGAILDVAGFVSQNYGMFKFVFLKLLHHDCHKIRKVLRKQLLQLGNRTSVIDCLALCPLEGIG